MAHFKTVLVLETKSHFQQRKTAGSLFAQQAAVREKKSLKMLISTPPPPPFTTMMLDTIGGHEGEGTRGGAFP